MTEVLSESFSITAFKKKLYTLNPHKGPPVRIEVQYAQQRVHQRFYDPLTVERELRQMLADKVSGNLVGLWLLVPEHLRLGTWDLLRGWGGHSGERLEPRIALQTVHEAVLCRTGIRESRTLTNRGGFELVNGLPFIGSDTAVHNMLNQRRIDETIRLQIALGKIRNTLGHFNGKILAIDPHRVKSDSKRRMRAHAKDRTHKATKIAQTFWIFDTETKQPLGFTSGTSACAVSRATPPLLDISEAILGPLQQRPLILADTEHISTSLFDDIYQNKKFDLLAPLPQRKLYLKKMKAISPQDFKPQWAGYATTRVPFNFQNSDSPTYSMLVQRNGERPDDWRFKGFLSTSEIDETLALAETYPERWHVEEFFNEHQALGWNRAGTMNLHIRYGHMTMALIAQAVLSELRKRLGPPWAAWDAEHMAEGLLLALDGDVRVTNDTIIVTYYGAQQIEHLKAHYENLPQKLERQGIAPTIPWLLNYKLDFRFR